MTSIFVYGTLKKGFHNHHLLADSTFIGAAIAQGRIYDLGGYPAMLDGNNIVYGEVYQVTPDALARIDRLEGFSPDRDTNANYYNRVVRPVMIGGVPQDAQMYLFNQDCPHELEIISGKYRNN